MTTASQNGKGDKQVEFTGRLHWTCAGSHISSIRRLKMSVNAHAVAPDQDEANNSSSGIPVLSTSAMGRPTLDGLVFLGSIPRAR